MEALQDAEVETQATAGNRPGTRYRVGEAVEVRRRFDRAWARGFEVWAVDDGGYRLLRCSDRSVLPVPFPASDLRPSLEARW